MTVLALSYFHDHDHDHSFPETPPYPIHHNCITQPILPIPLLLPLLLQPTPPINLLLQHNTIHARLEQRKHQARLALQLAQAVEDGRRRRAGEVVEVCGELYSQYIYVYDGIGRDKIKYNGRLIYRLHVLGQALVLVEDFLL